MNRGKPPLSWRRIVRSVPADLLAVLSFVGLTDLVILLPIFEESLVRAVLGLVFVLFVPGYVLVSALFPEAGRPRSLDQSTGEPTPTGLLRSGRERIAGRIDGPERLALSVALSIAVVAVLVIGTALTPLPYAVVPTTLLLSAATVTGTAVAARRRLQVPEHSRFSVPVREWVADGTGFITGPGSRNVTVLNVALAVAVLFAVGTLGFAVLAPQGGEQFTSFYALTETDDGELVADGYPTEFAAGEQQSVVLAIDNHEGESAAYTVVVQLQRVQPTANETETDVVERAQLDRLRTRVGANESWRDSYQIQPTMSGENLRVAFLLYRGSAPSNPTAENAYRELHLWVTVAE
ncbi:DUF1616 domain-containing protein [Haloarcula salinisoli]|uniref:DUF1616 domain-containing protein n=1 Tax=Haloarcula salinisoli TaxID=2487746 RepID=A0A8J7YQ71_9EURY|nr:DUF1616 domain-containing protein [Halomicroarcula salinisoli]MBX0288389.1 DUF1616 domain-containing protein [Halomicroarcula salinisoli]MBX0305871.1 DUF1616 domain-containing protein [Halomicroarcula salinisoli]